MDEYERLKELSFKISKSFDSDFGSVSRMLASVNQLYASYSDVAPALARISEETRNIINEVVLPSTDLHFNYEQLFAKVADYQGTAQASPAVAKAISALEAAEPFLPEPPAQPEDQETPETPRQYKPLREPFTRNELWQILALILTLISLIKAFSPEEASPPAEDHAQTVIIQKQIIVVPNDYSAQDKEKVVERLEDAAFALAEELDVFGDEAEDFENPVEGDTEPDADDGLDGDTERQD